MLQACIYGNPTRVEVYDVLQPINKQQKNGRLDERKKKAKCKELALPCFMASNHL